ncbi:MAG: insulinase family protein, partial [Xanthomonadales bacterium]|nr:insulinase family protein [Xanthomonadales bacterium]
AAVAILGGLFSSRLNMNLREDKHWAYGAYAFLSDALGPRPLMLYAPVQTDHTADALAELRGELQAYLGDRPPTAEELKKINDNQIRGLPGQYETAGAVAGAMLGVLRYQRPANWVAQTKQRLEAVTVAQTTEAARTHIRPERLVWLVVGDLQAIEGPVRELGLGRVQVLDESGAVLR